MAILRPPVNPDDWIVSAAEPASEEERRQFFADREDLVQVESVRRLCDRVTRELANSLGVAERLAATAHHLAERLGDPYSRGRAHRASMIVAIQRRDYPTALGHAETALRCFEESGDALQGAITRSSGIHGLSHLGFHRRALEWAEAAEEVFVRLGDELRLARLRLNVGTLLARRDRFAEALEHYRSAHRSFLAIGRVPDVGTSLRNIAVTLQCDHQLDRALDAYREARTYCEANGLPLLVVEIDYNIAYLHYLQGEYARALRLFEISREKCEELGDRQHMALCDLEQSEIYLELNLVAEASRLAARAREELERLEMGYEVGKCLTNLALAEGRQGRGGEALRLLDRAREYFLAEKNPIWVAAIDLYRSQVLVSEGRRAEATEPAEAALEVFLENDLAARAARCEIHLARLELAAEKPEAARAFCLSALARLGASRIPALEYRLRVLQGRAEEQLGNPTAAGEAYRSAERMLERLRTHLQSDELKISFLEDKLEVYEGLVWLGFHREERSPELLFEEIEKAKSRSLTDLLAVRVDTIRAKKTDPQDLAERLRRQRRELNGYYRQLDQTETDLDTQSGERIEKLRRRMAQGEEELLQTLRRLQNTDRELSSLQEGFTVGPGDLQEDLPAESALLEYFFARGKIFLCAVHKTGIQVFALGSVSRAEELLRALRYQLSKLLLEPEYVNRFGAAFLRDVRSRLRDLYALLIPAELRDLAVRHLVVVPHGVLHYLPFQALFDGESYLIDRFSLSYAPSAGVYSLCRRRSPALGRGSLVMGVADEKAPWIRREAERVAAGLPGSRLLVGEEADEDALREHGAEARIVHLAAHGRFRRDNPMFSSIQLGSGRLSLFDLYNLELDADLVVLSGCGTGLSDVRSGDELVGLTRGLLYAGARTVAVSLWDVNDETTTALMGFFYEGLGKDRDPATALRQAMVELREAHPHPYYWAPFVLIGDAFKGSFAAGEAVGESGESVEPPAAGLLA